MLSKTIPNSEFFALVEQELQENGHVRFRVKGTSMQPMLRNGQDEVLLRKRAEEKIPDIGDICLFLHHGHHVLHRLIERDGDDFVMQGDNIVVAREVCPLEDILGIVEKVYRDDVELEPDDALWQKRIRSHRRKQRVRLYLARIKGRVAILLRE